MQEYEKELSPEDTEEEARRVAKRGALYFKGGPSREHVERILEIGRSLSDARKEQGLTRAQLAAQIGIGAKLIYFAEWGLIFPEEIPEKAESLDKLARSLGQDPDTLRQALLGK